MAGFAELQRHLEAKSSPSGALLAFLETRRRDFEIERDLAHQLTQHLASAERRPVRSDAWAALQTYCEAIADYFYPANNIAHTTWYTRLLDKVRGQVERGHTDVWWDPSISGDPKGDHAREQLLHLTTIALRDLPEAFKPINASFAELQTKLL